MYVGDIGKETSHMGQQISLTFQCISEMTYTQQNDGNNKIIKQSYDCHIIMIYKCIMFLRSEGLEQTSHIRCILQSY